MNKEKLHIFFNIDDNMLVPACVCTSSLLHYADTGTYYVLHILHGKDLTSETRSYFSSLFSKQKKLEIFYHEVTEDLSHIPQIRGFTETAYYRLYAYKYFYDIERIIYLDVDLCVKCDLSELYNTTTTTDWYIAGVRSCYTPTQKSNVTKIGADPETYVNAGVLLFNLEGMRKGDYAKKLEECIHKIYPDLDQDIINICAKGKTINVHYKYNFTPQLYFGVLSKNKNYDNIAYSEFVETIDNCIIHYNGPKPWNNPCARDDIWWAEYKRSPIFNWDFYNSIMIKRKGIAELTIVEIVNYLRVRTKHRLKSLLYTRL